MLQRMSRVAVLLAFALVLTLGVLPAAEAAMNICWECYSASNGNEYCDPYPWDHGGTECYVIAGNCHTTGECSHHLQITR